MTRKLTAPQDKRFEVTPKTEFQDFLAVLKEDRRTANIDRDILKFIFERVRQFLSPTVVHR